MFAITRSTRGRSISSASACRMSSSTPFAAAFRLGASTAAGSRATAWDGGKPRVAGPRAVPPCFPPGRLARSGLEVEGVDRRKAELGRRDREDARAAAHVDQASGLELGQELEAEPRGRVRPCAERAARVDDHRDAFGRRLLPRRPDPQWPDPDRLVELAPSLLPPRLDERGLDPAELCTEPLLPRAIRVDGEPAMGFLQRPGRGA